MGEGGATNKLSSRLYKFDLILKITDI